MSDTKQLRALYPRRQSVLLGSGTEMVSYLLIAFCISPMVLSLGLWVIGKGAFEAVLAQITLAMGTFGGLLILRRYPIVNPLQAVILFFHWWFAYGPTVCGTYWSLQGNAERADLYIAGGITCSVIVACGLPFYALGARAILHVYKPRMMDRATPSGPTYNTGILIRFAVFAGSTTALLWLLGLFGLHAFDSVNYLGGQATVTWWLVPFAEANRLVDFALAAGCSLLALPRSRSRLLSRWVALGVIAFSLERALTSGSKGPLIFPIFYYILAFVNWRRRVPWFALTFCLVGYLVIVEPFVAAMRLRVERTGQATVEDRKAMFWEGWRNLSLAELFNNDINVESPFRGIYLLAKKTADRSTLLSGPWNGESIKDGVSAMLPRALFPDKAPSNMGNYFAHELGAASLSDNLQNVAITIPFELVGNFGWVAGVLSFGALGCVWAIVVAIVLTPGRMTTHPLTPYLIVFSLGVESSVGQFGNALKMFTLLLPLLYMICRVPLTQRNHGAAGRANREKTVTASSRIVGEARV